MQANCGNMTFLEVYEQNGMILNVTVAADRKGDKATLLNYLTSPHVLVWSAVVACCCCPGLFKMAEISMRDPKTGATVPYMPGQKWYDGSVVNDLPRRQLTEMFHCSFFIVSQVNPHVIPFVKNHAPSIHKKPTGWLKSLWFAFCAEAGHWIEKGSLVAHESAPTSGRAITEFLYSLFRQDYTGDVTIYPIGTVWDAIPDFVNITTNPTSEHMMYVGGRGMRRTLPYLHRIRCLTEVERVLEAETLRLKRQVQIESRTEALRREKI